MQISKVNPNSITFANVLPLYATMGSLKEGMNIYQRVVHNRFSSNDVIVSALVVIHAKYQVLQKAHKLFDKMNDVNTISLIIMIASTTKFFFP